MNDKTFHRDPSERSKCFAIPTINIQPVGSNSPKQHKNHDNDQDGANDTDAAVTVAVSVTTETPAEAASQENDKEDNKNEPHGFAPLVRRT